MDSSWRRPLRPLSPTDQEALDRLVDQVATLWPYLNFNERYDWAQRVTACSGEPIEHWPSVGLPLIMEKVKE
jgi:hypothetical protein